MRINELVVSGQNKIYQENFLMDYTDVNRF